MDFFEHQELAQRKTGRLVVLFLCAVVAIVVGVNVAVALALASQDGEYTPGLAALVSLGTLAIIGLGTMYRLASLKGGGRVVAEELGGRRLSQGGNDPKERRLLNVVEEMAIAAGAPVPAVYVLDQEHGINAFAAGWSPADAVIGVTRGALEQLDRDELQGVVAHEFSHILHGDMRLNVRLIGLLYGILLLGLIGIWTLRSMHFSRGGRRSSGKNGGSAIVVVIGIGVALMVLGYAGTFFGNLIKAAVSRQREFLADSSAVQYTRNPLGIAGALMRIGGLSEGSRLVHPRANETSHMFFGAGVRTFLGGLHATHPPLEERVTRIVPALKGRIEKALRGGAAAKSALQLGAAGLAAEFPALVPRAQSAQSAPPAGTTALAQVGAPTALHLERARALLDELPAELTRAAAEPHGARAVLYALLLDPRAEVSAHQLATLERSVPADLLIELERLAQLVEALPRAARLPLVELALPALAELSEAQHGALMRELDALAEADGLVTLEELTIQRLVHHHLDPLHERRSAARARRAGRATLAQRVEPLRVLLSALARAGADGEPEAARAFEAAWQRTRLGANAPLPASAADARAFGAALDALDELAPLERRRLLEAAAAAVEHDGVVREEEVELFRLIAVVLDAPVPPPLPGQRLA